MLDQPFMTDIIEASSISHMPQVIDIYSASWGPTDNGKTVDGPRELTLQAMADGVNKVMALLSTFEIFLIQYYYVAVIYSTCHGKCTHPVGFQIRIAHLW